MALNTFVFNGTSLGRLFGCSNSQKVNQGCTMLVSKLLEGLRPASKSFSAHLNGNFRFRLINTSSCSNGSSNSNFGSSRRSFDVFRANQMIKNLNSQQKPSNPVLKVDKKTLTVKTTESKPGAEKSAKTTAAAGTVSIFKRFKEAYKQHGKILIWTHLVTSVGWTCGFLLLARRFVVSRFLFFFRFSRVVEAENL